MIEATHFDCEWVFGRDGSLTARDASGVWLAGCSMPLRAAQEMLRKLDVKGAVACFLAPTHAAQIRAALERMRPEQAIVVLLPESEDLLAILHCQDFAPDIGSHRLWFLAGPQWQEQMLGLFDDRPGLATPAQFIKVPVIPPELIERLIPAAQDVITRIAQQRSQAMQGLRSQAWASPATTKLLVVAPSQFRLWNDLGHAVTSAADSACEGSNDVSWELFDADDPLCSSPLRLAQRGRECSALLTANTARGDLPGLLPDELPWLTWVTGARIPAFSAAGSKDQLILADPATLELAYKAGWERSRLHVATWPPLVTRNERPSSSPFPGRLGEGTKLAIIADTTSLDAPEELNDYSSHTLLWDAIRSELLRDPLAIGTDINAYLNHRIRQLELEIETFPRAVFIDQLIVPACQQGLARLLLGAKISLRLFGKGWSDVEAFAPHAGAPVESREQLAQILRQCKAVLHVWPGRLSHPVDHAGVRVVHPWGRKRSELSDAVRNVSSDIPKSNDPCLDRLFLRNILLKICR